MLKNSKNDKLLNENDLNGKCATIDRFNVGLIRYCDEFVLLPHCCFANSSSAKFSNTIPSETNVGTKEAFIKFVIENPSKYENIVLFALSFHCSPNLVYISRSSDAFKTKTDPSGNAKSFEISLSKIPKRTLVLDLNLSGTVVIIIFIFIHIMTSSYVTI